jgi:hypothetical protein
MQKSGLLNLKNFVALCESATASNGLNLPLIYTLYDSDPNLLTQDNFDSILKLIPFARYTRAALESFSGESKLTQPLFDAIVANPIDALFIAAKSGGLPDRKYPDTTAFLDMTRATRVLSQIYQNRSAQIGLLFQLPAEILHQIAEHTADHSELSNEVRQHILKTTLPSIAK